MNAGQGDNGANVFYVADGYYKKCGNKIIFGNETSQAKYPANLSTDDDTTQYSFQTPSS